MPESVVAWNLILCAICFPALGWFIKVSFRKDQVITEMRFQALAKDMEELRRFVEMVRLEIETKTDKIDSVKSDFNFDRHDHIIDCDSQACTAKTTTGIVLRHRAEQG